MSEPIVEPLPPVTHHVVLPERPKPHSALLTDADAAIAYLGNMVDSSKLNPDLRIMFNTIQNTIRNLRDTVSTMDAQADDSHEKMVKVIQSQRLLGG